PIIPEFLFNINHPDAPLDGPARITTTTTTTTTPNPCPCEQYNQNINNYSTTAALEEYG
ncbi:hypothetical protein JTB14_021864, partial [Gonioctena quinquepunctata]